MVIGKIWLTTADEWGRRRIDDSNDWVRQEICAGLAGRRERRTHIIPILLEGAQRPQAAAFDDALRTLAEIEPAKLDDDGWESQLEELIISVAAAPGLRRIQPDGDRNPNARPHGLRNGKVRKSPCPAQIFAWILNRLATGTCSGVPIRGVGGVTLKKFANHMSLSRSPVPSNSWRAPQRR